MVGVVDKVTPTYLQLSVLSVFKAFIQKNNINKSIISDKLGILKSVKSGEQIKEGSIIQFSCLKNEISYNFVKFFGEI